MSFRRLGALTTVFDIRGLVRRLAPRGQFARGVGLLVGGTAAGQAIMVLATPFLARLYGPDSFGLLALFSAILAFASVVACLRYELAIPLPEDDIEAANLLGVCLANTGIISLVTAVFVYFYSSSLANYLGSPALGRYLWLLPIAVLFAGFYQALEKWSARSRRFADIAKTKFLQSSAVVLLQLLLVKFGAGGLIFGQAAGQCVGSGRLASIALRSSYVRTISWRGMWRVTAKYKQFPAYSVWNALLNTASLQFAPLIFVAMFGTVTAGLYALTLRILTIPSNLIGGAVGSAFLAHAPQARRDGVLQEFVEGLTDKLVRAGVPVLILIMVGGPDIFRFAFGEEWREAGKYAQWMAPWIYLQFQWSPLSTLASVMNLQRAALVAQLLSLIARGSALLICLWTEQTADFTIMSFAVVSALVYLLIQLWFMSKVGCKKRVLISSQLDVMLRFFLFAAPSILIYVFGNAELKVVGALLFSMTSAFWYYKILRMVH